ncbi:MAG: LuxR family transcriptional regulator, partial [Ktedonobacteraceae bacterium]|nr:LuxR family transcriptional regulator [Ktedonobacteraceae bacterium]
AAADYPSAARMMEQEAPRLWLSGEAQTVFTWIIALPDAVLWQHALLALNALLFLLQALHMTSETFYGSMQARGEQTMARLEALLHRQEEYAGMSEGEQARPCSELTVIRRRLRLLRALIETRAMLQRGDKERLEEMIQELEELGLDEEIRWNMIVYSLRFWLVEPVQREGALLIPWLLKVKQHVLKAGDWLANTRVREWLAFAYLRAGKWHQVERECLAALALIEQRGERTMWAGYLYYFLSLAYYAWNRLDEAAGAVRQVLRIAQDWQQVDLLGVGSLAFAQISIARGNPTAADQALQQAETLARQEHLVAHTHQVAGMQAQCWLAVGNLEAASHWAEQVVFSQDTWNPNDKDALLTQIRIYLAQRQDMWALALLDHFREQLDQPGDIYTAMQYLAASVVALHQTGKQEQARATLTRLLALTGPEDNLRVYLDLGEPMKQALKMLLSAPSNAPSDASSASFSMSYILRLLASFEQEEAIAAEQTSNVGQPFALTQEIQPSQAEGPLFRREPLSPQELKVLQLLVTGRTYAEMAESQLVSIHTIKTQVSSIYRKLGVSRRAEAIAAGQHFHLL